MVNSDSNLNTKREAIMQILILYYSKGANTRKLAKAIAEGVKEVEGVEPNSYMYGAQS